jgi:hypothetical protein
MCIYIQMYYNFNRKIIYLILISEIMRGRRPIISLDYRKTRFVAFELQLDPYCLKMIKIMNMDSNQDSNKKKSKQIWSESY